MMGKLKLQIVIADRGEAVVDSAAAIKGNRQVELLQYNN